MRKLIFFCLLATSSLLGQQQPKSPRNAHCPVVVGVQMPAGKMPSGRYPAKMTLYFLPPFTKQPECFVDFGEAQLDATVGFVRIAGKPETRVDIRCRELE